jgi:hypothetical protein
MLCENAEIIAYGEENNIQSFVDNIENKIKKFYGV